MQEWLFNKRVKYYRRPVTKIVISALVIIILIFRNSLFCIDIRVWNIALGVAAVAVGLFGILCIYCSIAEIILIHEKRSQESMQLNHTELKSKEYHLDEIISLLINNDIIDITLTTGEQIISVGSKADCNVGSSVFFDKCYYLNEVEIKELKDLEKRLQRLFPEKIANVIMIGGVCIKTD